METSCQTPEFLAGWLISAGGNVNFDIYREVHEYSWAEEMFEERRGLRLSSLQVRIWMWREAQRTRMEACEVMLPAAELSQAALSGSLPLTHLCPAQSGKFLQLPVLWFLSL